MDVIGVYVGCLNGVFSQTYCNSQYQTPFARNWASVEDWPSGEGPGLTSSDLQNILAADLYGQCRGGSAVGPCVCPSPDSPRISLTQNQDMQYQQPHPAGKLYPPRYHRPS